MSLPVIDRIRVEQTLNAYCREKDMQRAAVGIKHRFRIRGDSVTLIRTEPGLPGFPGPVDIPYGQLRYSRSARRWMLYSSDRNGKWHFYILSEPALDFKNLIRDLDEDPIGVFGSRG